MLRRESDFIDEVIEDYPFLLPNGASEPLDRILEMLDENDIAIEDLFISNITDQYLEYVSTLDALDIEKAVSFAYYASVLLDLKVRAMLPKTEEETVQFEEDRSRFIDELSIRQLLNKMKKNLENKEVKCRYFVEPEYTDEDCNYCISNFSLEELINSYLQIKELETIRGIQKAEGSKLIAKDRFTVLDKSKELVALLKEKKEIKFTDIAKDDYTKSEKINAFLALLELLRRQFAEVEQDFICGEITIRLAENSETIDFEKLFKGDYDSYEFTDNEDKKSKSKEKKSSDESNKKTTNEQNANATDEGE